ncbi:unnamed protein product, partial [Laminaria digitata]
SLEKPPHTYQWINSDHARQAIRYQVYTRYWLLGVASLAAIYQVSLAVVVVELTAAVMDEDDDDMVGWEEDADANPDPDADGEDIAWEDAHDDDDNDHGRRGGGKATRSDDDDDDDDAYAGRAGEQDKDQDEEPEERRWLGDNGEIVVELPRDDESEDGLHEAKPGDGDGDIKGKGKQKAKVRRFTAEENRQALNVHKTHLSCLVARCALVSRWAGDPSVQAAMVSCLPIDLLPRKPVPVESLQNSLHGTGALEVASKQAE